MEFNLRNKLVWIFMFLLVPTFATATENVTFDDILHCATEMELGCFLGLGAVVSPSNPSLGFGVFLFAIVLFLYGLSFASFNLKQTVINDLKQHNELSSKVKMSLIIATGAILYGWYLFFSGNNLAEIQNLGAKISPASPFTGWLLFGAFVYLTMYMYDVLVAFAKIYKLFRRK